MVTKSNLVMQEKLYALKIRVEIGINVDEDLITIFMEDQPKKLHFFDESIGRFAKMNCYVI